MALRSSAPAVLVQPPDSQLLRSLLPKALSAGIEGSNPFSGGNCSTRNQGTAQGTCTYTSGSQWATGPLRGPVTSCTSPAEGKSNPTFMPYLQNGRQVPWLLVWQPPGGLPHSDKSTKPPGSGDLWDDSTSRGSRALARHGLIVQLASRQRLVKFYRPRHLLLTSRALRTA